MLGHSDEHFLRLSEGACPGAGVLWKLNPVSQPDKRGNQLGTSEQQPAELPAALLPWLRLHRLTQPACNAAAYRSYRFYFFCVCVRVGI